MIAESFKFYDEWLLRFMNVEWSHPLMDSFWLTITQLHKLPWFQYAVVPALLAWLVYIYRGQAWKPLLALTLTVVISDSLAYRVIKSLFFRQRPFQNDELDWLRHVGQAHGSSFPSNHAANVFAGALVLAWYFPRARYFFYTLATLIALSRVALGVHYPSDAISGAMLGIFVGILVRGLLLNQFKIFQARKRTRRPQ
jgi:undecaprenyl-diphosphatase